MIGHYSMIRLLITWLCVHQKGDYPGKVWPHHMNPLNVSIREKFSSWTAEDVLWEGSHSGKQQGPLVAEHIPWLVSSQKDGLQSYNPRELHSSNNHQPWERMGSQAPLTPWSQPGDTLSNGPSTPVSGLSTSGNCEAIKAYSLKLLNLW